MTLAYAKKLALVAKTEKKVKQVLTRLKCTSRKKKLELKVRILKIMVFKKGGRDMKFKWRWGVEKKL